MKTHLTGKCLVAILLVTACSSGEQAVRPQVKPLIEAVYASGFVVAQDEYQVFSQVDGTVVAKAARDGNPIGAGDVLFLIGSEQQSARHRAARRQYELAVRNSGERSPLLQQQRALLEAARSKVQFDSVNYVRYTNLFKQNATTATAYDKAKLQLESSQAELTAQLNQYKNLYDQLALEKQTLLSQLQVSDEESDRYVVRSEVAGTVFKTFKEEGELVRRGEPLAVVGRSNTFYVQLSVDEQDILRVAAGQTVYVRIDAFAGKVFTARITNVYPFVNKQQQSLRVDAAFEGPLPAAISGLAVEANIVVRQKTRAVVIPKAALLPGDSVWLKSNDGVSKVHVTKGIETLDLVEITGGLDTAQQVLIRQ